MKKLLLNIFIFFLSFLFCNVNSYGTYEFNRNNYINKDNTFNLEFDNLNILNVEELFKDLNIKILKVIPKDKFFTNKAIVSENIEDIINTYKNVLLYNGFDNEGMYSYLNGFKVSNLIVECSTYDIEKLSERINYKVI